MSVDAEHVASLKPKSQAAKNLGGSAPALLAHVIPCGACGRKRTRYSRCAPCDEAAERRFDFKLTYDKKIRDAALGDKDKDKSSSS